MRRKGLAALAGLLGLAWGGLWLTETLVEPGWRHLDSWVPWGEGPNPLKKKEQEKGEKARPPFPKGKEKEKGLLLLSLSPLWRFPEKPSLVREVIARGLQGMEEDRAGTLDRLAPLPIWVAHKDAALGGVRFDLGDWERILPHCRVLVLLLDVPSLDPPPTNRPSPSLGDRLRRLLPLVRVNRGKALPQPPRPAFFPKALRLFLRGGFRGEARHWKRIRDRLETLGRLATQAKVELIPLYLPLPFEVDGAVSTRLLGDLALDTRQFESSRPGRRFRDLCRELALPHVPTLAVLRHASAKDKRPLYRPVGGVIQTSSALSERGLRLLFRPLLPRLKKALSAPR